jgi:hypothetical protein
MLLPPVVAEDAHKTDRKSVWRPRVELITRGERRRRWSSEQKQEKVAESLGPDRRRPRWRASMRPAADCYTHGARSCWPVNSAQRYEPPRPSPRSRLPMRQDSLIRLITRRWNQLARQRRHLGHGSKG